MGIAPYKTFTFDGESSADYGIYITGEGVFNAPERAVEMVEIPNRNGAFALDKGRFENIEVTYRIGLFDEAESDFADKVSAFRNWICSKVGYCRLEDEYNPDEYRMAVYKEGVKLEHDFLIAGEAEITFDCKPQRWLKSGEEAVTIGEWGETETVSGEVVEVEATEAETVKSLVADIVPIQSGSGTPSPQNIRPISGTDSVSVYDIGTNIWDEQWEVGALYSSDGSPYSDNTRIRSKNYCACSPNTTYYLYVGSGIQFYVYEYDSNKTFIQRSAQSGSFTTTSNCAFFKLMGYQTYGTTYNNDISVNYPSTEHNYHTYNGNTYTTALGRTVYGGTLDLVSGLLTVTHAIVDIGSVSWTYNSVFRTYDLSSRNYSWSGVICSAYKTATQESGFPDMANYTIKGSSTSTTVGIRDDSFNGDANAFKTAMTGQKIVYELATPQTYQLTAQQIELLLGTNNIWADSGDVTLEYGQNPSVLVNPTPFEAEPLLAVDGYGTIDFNGYEVEIENVPIGDITLYDGGQWNAVVLDESNLNVGDTIRVNAKMLSPYIETVLTQSMAYHKVRNVSITCSGSGYTATFGSHVTKSSTDHLFYIDIIPTSFTLVSGTNSTITNNVSGSFQVAGEPSGFTLTFSFTQTYTYTASTHTITYDISNISVSSSAAWCAPTLKRGTASYYSIIGDSTKSAISDAVYIDCDIGECWTVQDGSIVSLNHIIALGSDLPKLASGNNTFTYDNTVDELNVTPRWWRV